MRFYRATYVVCGYRVREPPTGEQRGELGVLLDEAERLLPVLTDRCAHALLGLLVTQRKIATDHNEKAVYWAEICTMP
eukprot:40778-Eustigmatos_ZCMA.PRE.1